MAQGFVLNLNLAESVTPSSDRKILDNLGGVNITQDILLFDGNSGFRSRLQNISQISRQDFQVIDDPDYGKTAVTNLVDNKVPFTNGTRISFDDGNDDYPYLVVNANAIDSFQIVDMSLDPQPTAPYSESDLAAPWVGQDIPNLILTRNDAITVENITNLSVERLPTNDTGGGGTGSGESFSGGQGGTEGAGDGADAEGGGDGGTAEDTGMFENLITYNVVDLVGQGVGRLRAKMDRVPLTYRDSLFTVEDHGIDAFRLRGNIRIVNTAQISIYNTTTEGGLNASAPGLYIYNTASKSEIRAFSGTDNPWEKAETSDTTFGKTALKTESAHSQVSNLIIAPDGGGSGDNARGSIPLFKTLNSSQSAEEDKFVDATTNVSEYTHKIPVVINGEQYFLLSKEV